MRFLREENWHFTISFLGYQDDGGVKKIIGAARNAAQSFAPPIIKLEKIVYGPPGRTARMIWLIGSDETSQSLSDIKKVLEDNLESAGVRFDREARPFTAHLTLARFEPAPVVSLPPVEKRIKFAFNAANLDVMESRLKRSGAEYEVLSSFAFRDKI